MRSLGRRGPLAPPWVSFLARAFRPLGYLSHARHHGTELGLSDGEGTQGLALGGKPQKGALRGVPMWAFLPHLGVGRDGAGRELRDAPAFPRATMLEDDHLPLGTVRVT